MFSQQLNPFIIYVQHKLYDRFAPEYAHMLNNPLSNVCFTIFSSMFTITMTLDKVT